MGHQPPKQLQPKNKKKKKKRPEGQKRTQNSSSLQSNRVYGLNSM
jgi:hypothetical protein